ncbi:cardiolipin synthase [Pseudactinotalea sp. HY158]|uniref:cardiolipin synthase n=1 Tax=Pseudactinotalea sp. HY158 TaxID=2654547 RepID=UPI00129C2114|nr:cardiolipin synthase [Pseudactinotalea sp. HY158]QGH68775.1 cardiolipin synthase [Pseudactinotalea sp. HY158]
MNDVSIWAVSLLAAHVLIILFTAFSISANRKPSSALAWLLVVIFVPLLGVVAYLLIGTAKLPQDRRDKQRFITELIMARTPGDLGAAARSTTWPDWFGTLVTLNRTLGALPMLPNNHAELLTDYKGMIARMVDDIDRAEKYVHVEFFILVCDETTAPFFDALARARERGVTVRVLTDHLSQLTYPFRRRTAERLARMGAEYHAMLPISPIRSGRRLDLRNHRKLVVIDGLIGHTGSMNLIADHYHKRTALRRGLHWRELMMRLQGPVVRELDAVFATDWYSETDELLPLDYTELPETGPGALDAQVLPSGPSFEADNNLKLFAAALHNARRRVSVTSPYFVPDQSVLDAMVTAAHRGLEVELFVAASSDQFMVYHAQRSYYEELLRAGVRIFLYHAPTVLHAKHISLDDEVAIIGTSNMDERSLSLHMELMVMFSGESIVADLRAVEDDYRARSRELHLEEWLARPYREQWLDNVMRLTSALM